MTVTQDRASSLARDLFHARVTTWPSGDEFWETLKPVLKAVGGDVESVANMLIAQAHLSGRLLEIIAFMQGESEQKALDRVMRHLLQTSEEVTGGQ